MKTKTIRLLLIAAFLFTSALATAEEVNVKRLHKTNWIQLETDKFQIITDANEKKAREMVDELERFSYFLSFLLGYEQNELPNKVTVILAKNGRTYSALGINENYAGVFASSPYGDFVIFANAKGFRKADSGKGSWGRSVVLHELTHLLMKNSTFALATPPWYNEGIAEYFGTYMEKNGSIVLGDVSILKNRFHSLVDRMGSIESVDTEKLFKTTQAELNIANQTTGDQRQFQGKFYARSVAVVHYLNSTPELRKQLLTYLYLIGKGYSVDETFAHVFETSYADLDKRVDDYIRGRHVYGRVFPMHVEGGIAFPEFHYEVRGLEQPQALQKLVSAVGKLSPSFLGEGNRDAMLKDAKALYPDLF